MAEIYEWDNSGSHGTIRSVKYTDDEIESINHMIAIEMFPWPHAVGLTKAFNLGVTIGQCEGEWSSTTLQVLSLGAVFLVTKFANIVLKKPQELMFQNYIRSKNNKMANFLGMEPLVLIFFTY